MNRSHTILQLLVKFTKAFHLPITISVGGTIFSGELTSEDEFIKDSLEKLHGSMKEGNLPGADAIMAQMNRGATPKQAGTEFLYLKNVVILAGVSQTAPVLARTSSGIWCIRIDAVEGFFYGLMTDVPSANGDIVRA
ncbi:hypothetical protein [Sorangium sp. So ce854]|uniref:hypothetical protein n=1 Tax=Sorangium sp. So ce854 TaxID=3133322 RepID=UPI003F5ECAB7